MALHDLQVTTTRQQQNKTIKLHNETHTNKQHKRNNQFQTQTNKQTSSSWYVSGCIGLLAVVETKTNKQTDKQTKAQQTQKTLHEQQRNKITHTNTDTQPPNQLNKQTNKQTHVHDDANDLR